MNRKALGWRDDPGHVRSIDSAPVLQYMKQGIFSFSLSPEFFERHHEAFVLSCGVGERLPDASLRVGGELREDRAVGPFLKLASHIRQLSNLHRCLRPIVR